MATNSQNFASSYDNYGTYVGANLGNSSASQLGSAFPNPIDAFTSPGGIQAGLPTSPALTGNLAGAGNFITVSDASAIQAAIDTMSRTSGGGVVFLKAGTYFVTSDINLRNGVTLRGAGSLQTIINFGGTTATLKAIGTISSQIQQFSVEGLELFNNTGTALLDIDYGLDFVMNDVVINTTTGIGLRLQHSQFFTIDHFIVTTCSGDGIYIVSDSTFPSHVFIIQNTTSELNGGDGFHLTQSNAGAIACTFFNCNASTNTSDGFVFSRDIPGRQVAAHVIACLSLSNGVDGYATGTDYANFMGSVSGSNGAYGFNASASFCSFIGCASLSDTSGAFTDSGTGTVSLGNSWSPSSIPPVGSISQFAGRSAPTGWLLCDGTAVSRTTYAALLAVIAPFGTFTVTIASPAVFSKTAHGLVAGDKLHFTTTGALPTGLSTNTDYFVITAGLTANAFEVSATRAGAAVNTSGSQSGTHTLYASNYGKGDGSTTFNVPDFRGFTPFGQLTGDANFDILNVPNTYAGEKTHTLTTAEMPAHTHDIDVYSTGGAVTSPTRNLAGNSISTLSGWAKSTGGGGAHNTLPPYVVVAYIIKT